MDVVWYFYDKSPQLACWLCGTSRYYRDLIKSAVMRLTDPQDGCKFHYRLRTTSFSLNQFHFILVWTLLSANNAAFFKTRTALWLLANRASYWWFRKGRALTLCSCCFWLDGFVIRWLCFKMAVSCKYMKCASKVICSFRDMFPSARTSRENG